MKIKYCDIWLVGVKNLPTVFSDVLCMVNYCQIVIEGFFEGFNNSKLLSMF